MKLKSATSLRWACLLVIPLLLGASKYYRWQDSNGVWQFTQLPPPSGQNAEQVSGRVPPKAGLSLNPSAPETPDAETAQTDDEAGLAPGAFRKDPQRCARARQNLQALSSNRPVRAESPLGQYILSKEQLAQQRQLAQQVIDIHC